MESVLKLQKKPVRLSPLVSILLAALIVVLLVAMAIPNLLRSRMASRDASRYASIQSANVKVAAETMAAPTVDLRRVVQTGSMRMSVADAAESAREIAAIARRRGGWVERSQLYGGDAQTAHAEITLRIPADMFDVTRAEIRNLGKKVDHEETGTADVTAQSVDLTAALRNYRAEEAQYLAIMARAHTVKDTLEVAQRLSEVRGRIERTQAQMNVLSRQVEMASLTVGLRAETGPTPSWSPLVSFRVAWRDALAGFADYIDAMFVVLLKIPLVLAWGFTLCGLAAVAWHLVRWIWKHWFVRAAPAAA